MQPLAKTHNSYIYSISIKNIKSKLDSSYADVYKLLGRFTADIARENKWIDMRTYRKFLDLFEIKKIL